MFAFASSWLCVLSARMVAGHRTLDGDRVFQDGKAAKELRIMASSFNAGNQIYGDGEARFDDLVAQMTGGHDGDGATAADLVFLGFQEFQDIKYQFAKKAKDHTMWRDLSERKLRELQEEVGRLTDAPDHIRAAREDIEADIRGFHSSIRQDLDTFFEEFGEHGNEFHQRLIKDSPARPLFEAPAKEPGNDTSFSYDAGAQAFEVLERRREAATRAQDAAFKRMGDAATRLHDAGALFPHAAVSEKWVPVNAWLSKAVEGVSAARAKFPNLRLNSEGTDTWDSMINEFREPHNSFEAELQSHQEQMRSAFKSSLTSFTNLVEQGVRNAQGEVSERLQQDWEDVIAALRKLKTDSQAQLAKSKFDLGLSQTATSSSAMPTAQLRQVASQWEAGTNKVLGHDLHQAELNLAREHVQVQLEPQKYPSGTGCGLFSHYDTVLYAFVNPWSAWKIEPVTYSSSTCAPRGSGASQPNRGCTIDNNEDNECGKVVNLLVFHASSGEDSLRVCALNTHMSFKSEATQRLKLLVDAMRETEQAQCDSVVFVGDFNTRLHCEAADYRRDGPLTGKPFFDRPFEGAFDTRFCTGDDCRLKGSELDELNQMLGQDEVRCWEKRESPGKHMWSSPVKYWEFIETNSTLKATGLREVSSVEFAPTYKLGQKQSKYGRDVQRCFPADRGACFTNEDGKYKHNPAWTDRVLVRSRAPVETKAYLRRPVTPSFGSDHAPVVAQLAITFEG